MTCMNFSCALKMLKLGQIIARDEWNKDNDNTTVLVKRNKDIMESLIQVEKEHPDTEGGSISKYNLFSNYVELDSLDLLAEDWYVVTDENITRLFQV